ncbi:MAG: Zn-dependent hydrolase [Mesorhizobium amorphae]|nr:MAG: Zn-dependent hydrolase [Mesorhizobium amorphae]
MPPLRLPLFFAFALLSLPAAAQDRPAEPTPSSCLAMAQALPDARYASFAPAPGPTLVQAKADSGEVTITYAGHSTYLIDTPAGVRVATDFSGVYGAEPPPRIATMNKAHRTHYTDNPDPRIEHVLPGWGEGPGAPARHALTVEDVYVRNVPTDIRRWGQLEEGGNSIFIFEVAGLCIGHLGHLHHKLEDAHYGAIGRLDVVMVPVDGGMTQSLSSMSEIATRLYSSVILPMHRHSTPMAEFLGLMGSGFAVDRRDGRSITVSLRTLPRQPTIVVLDGV